MPARAASRRFRHSLGGLCLLALLLLPLLHLWPALSGLNNAHLDWLIRQRAAEQTPDPRLLLIDIDDLSLQVLAGEAGKWPWPRSLHGELLEYLLSQQPKAVAFDILFSEPDQFNPDADSYFAEVLQRSDNTYLAALVQQADEGSQPPLLRDYPASTWQAPGQRGAADQRGLLLLPNAFPSELWRLGSINFRPDADGIGRRYELYRSFADWRLPSMPARIVHDLTGSLPQQQSLLLDWPGNTRLPYPRLPYAAVLAAARNQGEPLAAEQFKNRIIVIGTTAAGLHDLRPTPLDTLYPAPFILMTAIDNLLNNSQLREADSWLELLGPLLLLLGLSLLLLREQLHAAFALCLFGSLALFVGSYWLALQGTLLGVLPGLICLWLLLAAALALFYLRRRQQLQDTIRLFSRFMDPVVVNQLVSRDDPEALLASKECQLTVLFSDIRNFTTLSEQHTPAEIVRLLEGYFSSQVEVLFKHQATLDKFIGDAIMAFWGAPLDNPQQADQAILAAMEMLDNLDAFRREYNCPDFDIGIGLHTGPAVVGLVGAQQRYDYTAIGDTVNLASRIEGLTKGRAHLLISAATREACTLDLDFVPQGEHQVKGRAEAVMLYEPRRRHDE
ncbi:CHASE2 domain-containing protein [Pseudomonas sp. MAC6]|uniref:CHASE2 domain-containing protein n=1 Tax=Pseudomonas sp. MAC6 TaxID=3401633 RepID=UPI003BF594EB